MLAGVFEVMVYRAMMLSVFYSLTNKVGEVGGQNASDYAGLMVTMTATTMNLFFIVIMNKV